jgi:hypothetical protein
LSLAEPKSESKSTLREIASEESDDKDLNSRTMAKILARKNAEKLCDNFASEESSDSEVGAFSRLKKNMTAQKSEASPNKKGKRRNPKIKNKCIWQEQLVHQKQGYPAEEREKDRSFRGCKGDYMFCKGIQGQNS